jgi:S-adenosylmethionine uptake transporter
MSQPRHPPMIAFLVGMAGIATFSAMDAVMKSLVLALGTFTTLFWRSLAGTAMAGALFARNPRWPDKPTMRLHLARGILGSGMAVLFFWGLARVPLAQAIALAFIAPLIAL